MANLIENKLNDSLLMEETKTQPRLSKDLSEAIDQLPIASTEKENLKDKLNDMVNEEVENKTETDPPDTRKSVDATRKSVDATRKSVDTTRKSVDTSRKSVDTTRKSVDTTDLSAPEKTKNDILLQSVEPETETTSVQTPKVTDTQTNTSEVMTEKSQQTFKPQIPIDKAEEEYTNQLNTTFKNWIDGHLNIDDNEKERINSKLTDDIVARKKFLQINPRATSREEDVYNLKNLLYRRINPVLSMGQLAFLLTDAGTLMNAIAAIPVPFMVVPLDFFPIDDSDTSDDQKLESDIKYQVNDWVDTLPVTIRNDDEKKDLDTRQAL
ncbi:uncharacterized protein LOC113507316 [Trichoplusia ni]|uniref:Uncharacterized protein LOC113507316 n=1 Tax=Trichoplusia ni TaxID=7111 RepID=A0A7E5X0N4_TRINI|nr:uncharacterized protein LOC113507316 [Trichoplusia ni]